VPLPSPLWVILSSQHPHFEAAAGSFGKKEESKTLFGANLRQNPGFAAETQGSNASQSS
jgi:hypothetical protein